MTKRPSRVSIAALAAFVGTTFGWHCAAIAQSAGESVVVEHAEIALPPKGAPMMSGYLVIRNGSEVTVAVEAVESDAFGSITIHNTTVEDGVARMRPAPLPLRIPGHSELQMKPGGMHLMIMEPRDGLEPGDTAGISVRLDDGRTIEADALLLPFGSRPSDHHHGASDE